MERLFDRFAGPVWEPFEMVAGEWAPKLDVSETKDAMVVTAELPGVDPEGGRDRAHRRPAHSEG